MSGMVQQQSYRSPQYQPSNSSASGPTPLSPRQNGQQRAKEERKLSASDYNNHRGAPQQQFKSERRISLSGMEEEKLKSHNNKGKTSPIEGKVRTRSGKKYGKPPVSPSDLHDFLRSFVLSNVSQNLSGTGTSEGNLCCKADLPSAADVSLDSWCDGPLRSPKDTSPLATSETIFKRLSPSELFSTVSAGRRTKEENRTPVKIEVVSHSNSLVHTCSEECSRQPQTPTSPTSLQGVTKQDLLSAYFELLLKQKQQSELSVSFSSLFWLPWDSLTSGLVISDPK